MSEPSQRYEPRSPSDFREGWIETVLTDFTTFVAVDKHTIRYLLLTGQTWARFHPELFDRPAVAICDGLAGDREYWQRELAFLRHLGWRHIEPRLWTWPEHEQVAAETPISQRERMLTAFVRLMHDCETPYALKVDVNNVAEHGGDGWIPDFATAATVYAPRWGYTVPADWIPTLDAWGRLQPLLNARPHEWQPIQGRQEFKRDRWRIYHRRFWSCLAFYERDFLRLASNLVPEPARLPVPSEDSYRWYVAHRLGLTIERTNPKRAGWAKRSRTSIPNLAKQVEELCRPKA
jgi:hypothetical protein